MAFDEVPEDVQGAPELPALDCDEADPDVLRLPPCDVPVRLLPDEFCLGDRSGSTRGSDRVW
jgi:hypothetical protein